MHPVDWLMNKEAATVLVASNNQGKIQQLADLLRGQDITLKQMSDFPELAETIENRKTIAGNARKKALEAAIGSGLPALADDSGLAIVALKGWPGVQSKRFAGENATHAERNQMIIDKMKDISDRRAKAITALALAMPDGSVKTRLGIVNGSITVTPDPVAMAQGGMFGSDSIFMLPNGQTFLEAPVEEKERNSSRNRALQKILPILKKLNNE